MNKKNKRITHTLRKVMGTTPLQKTTKVKMINKEAIKNTIKKFKNHTTMITNLLRTNFSTKALMKDGLKINKKNKCCIKDIKQRKIATTHKVKINLSEKKTLCLTHPMRLRNGLRPEKKII